MLGGAFGPYPFSTVGAIVDNQDDLFFALETQTRPVYSKLFWQDGQGNPVNGDSVVVHELAHQWFGDKVALAPLAGHLAQRGLRDLRRVAVGRARGTGDAAGDLPSHLRRHSCRRPVLGRRDRRPDSRASCSTIRSTSGAL